MSEKGPDYSGRESFMKKGQLDAIVANLAGEVLKAQGFNGQATDSFMETEESIVLMDILEKMVKNGVLN